VNQNVDNFPLPCGKITHLIIAYFLSNTSAKNYRNEFMSVRVIARQNTDIFETQCS